MELELEPMNEDLALDCMRASLWVRNMSPEDRLRAIEIITKGICIHCGQLEIDQKCQCQNGITPNEKLKASHRTNPDDTMDYFAAGGW